MKRRYRESEIESFPRLHRACRDGNVELVRYLTAVNNDVNCLDSFNFTPIFYAVESGKREIVDLLLESGAKINFKNQYSPLHHAAFIGSAKMVKYLLSKGAYINDEDKHGRTAYHVAAENGHYNIGL